MDKKFSPICISLLGCIGAAGTFSTAAFGQDAEAPRAQPRSDGEEIGEVVVTGFRASLQNSVAEKRENIAFTDSIFAEDIGKFPDLNLAESLQRIPGVQIARDFTGEGTSVAVRGLGRDFTQITLNGAPVETASDSNIDTVSQGRGIDLVLFPTELFSQLTVSKTPTASQQSKARSPRTSTCASRVRSTRRASTSTTPPRQLPGVCGGLEPAPRRLREQHLGHRRRRIRHPRRCRVFEPQVPLRRFQHHRLHHRRYAGCPTTQPGCNSPRDPGRQSAGRQCNARLRQLRAGVGDRAAGRRATTAADANLWDHDNNAATAQQIRFAAPATRRAAPRACRATS